MPFFRIYRLDLRPGSAAWICRTRVADKFNNQTEYHHISYQRWKVPQMRLSDKDKAGLSGAGRRRRREGPGATLSRSIWRKA